MFWNIQNNDVRNEESVAAPEQEIKALMIGKSHLVQFVNRN